MFLMADINRSAVIRTANFVRGKDKRKRKKKRGINYKETKDTVKVGQKLASTGTNISREVRGVTSYSFHRNWNGATRW
jgi:hypothetical protein